jgi:hypothetical protein
MLERALREYNRCHDPASGQFASPRGRFCSGERDAFVPMAATPLEAPAARTHYSILFRTEYPSDKYGQSTADATVTRSDVDLAVDGRSYLGVTKCRNVRARR